MKRIVIFCDGTWNKPGNIDGGKPVRTNVQLLYRRIPPVAADKVMQMRFYESGVGTTSSIWDQMMGGIKGMGIDNKIKEVYRFLVDNYEAGDHIFLFGFSRGAYTVRSLAGLIRNCGILKPEFDYKIDEAYKVYRDRTAETGPDSVKMKNYRERFACEPDTRIKFIGVWDTVGSLGLPLNFFQKLNNRKYSFHDVTLGKNVDNAFHAVAIDEKRVKFAPAIWEIDGKPDPNQNLEQRWFCGAHCNVGGSFTNTCLSDIALKWLAGRAKHAGLDHRDFSTQNNEHYTFDPKHTGEIEISRVSFYKIFKSYLRPMALQQRMRDGKTVITNETVDDSVWDRMDAIELKYTSTELERIRKLHEEAKKRIVADNTPSAS